MSAEEPPLIEPPVLMAELPPTWVIVVCEHSNADDTVCVETWTVDIAEFDPPLSTVDVERMLTPFLLEHEATHA